MARGVFHEGGEAGGHQFGAGALELAGSLADLALPVEAAIGLEPLAEAGGLLEGEVDGAAGFGLVEDEGGPQGFEGFEGIDLGVLGHGRLALVEVFLNAGGFAEQKGGMFFGDFHEFAEGFHGGDEVFGEFFLFLVLPGGGEGGEASVEGGGAALDVFVEALEFFGEAAHLFGIHDCLGHREKEEKVRKWGEPVGGRVAV